MVSVGARRRRRALRRRVRNTKLGTENESLVEQRIRAAQEDGEFDDLPGAGKPLPAEEPSLVPPELRVAYRILKNAGFSPPEVSQRAEIAALEAELANDSDRAGPDAGAARARALRRLSLLRAQTGMHGISAAEQDYREELLARLSGTDRDPSRRES